MEFVFSFAIWLNHFFLLRLTLKLLISLVQNFGLIQYDKVRAENE